LGAITLALFLGERGILASPAPEQEDESVNWIVEDTVDLDFSESAVRAVRSPLPGTEEKKSIQQIQQEEFGMLDLKTEADTDKLSDRIPLALPRGKRAAGNLEKRVLGWHPYWKTNTYERYDYSKLSTIAYFSYEVNPTNGSYAMLRSWDTTSLIDWAHSNDVKVVLTATLFGSANNETLLTNATSCANLN